jgi:hypothetical protein
MFSNYFEKRDKAFAACNSHTETIFKKQNVSFGTAGTCHVIIPKDYPMRLIFNNYTDDHGRSKEVKDIDKEIEITIYSDYIYINLYARRTPLTRAEQIGLPAIFEHKIPNNENAINTLCGLLSKIYIHKDELLIEYADFDDFL